MQEGRTEMEETEYNQRETNSLTGNMESMVKSAFIKLGSYLYLDNEQSQWGYKEGGTLQGPGTMAGGKVPAEVSTF